MLLRNSIPTCLAFFGVAQAWYMDISCLPYSAWLIQGMNGAFANAASVGTLVAQGNSNALDMMGWLFGSSGSADALARLASVQHLSTFRRGDIRLVPNYEAMVFCDYSRIATEPVNGYWHDTRSDTLLNNDAYIRCTPGITGKLVFGWTGQYDYKPDQIQLCPWFLTFMWRQKFSQSDQVDPSWLVHIPQEAMDAMNAVHSTPIDGFALLEKLLLHELTHTTVAGRSEDLVSKSLPDYGWLYCLDVATPHGSANAENLAYAGVGASLIVKKLKLNKNGGFDL